MTRLKLAQRQLKTMSVDLRNLADVELILEEIPVRNRETGEGTTAWQVDHPNLNRPCRGNTPREALEIFVECLETDDEAMAIDLNELADG